jgi:hypothetical protein
MIEPAKSDEVEAGRRTRGNPGTISGTPVAFG